jgi:hypothetical protein
MDLNDNKLQHNIGFYPEKNQLINNNKMGSMLNSNQQIPNHMQNFNQMNNMYGQFNNNRQNG